MLVCWDAGWGWLDGQGASRLKAKGETLTQFIIIIPK
jgi:hypothetical protein